MPWRWHGDKGQKRMSMLRLLDRQGGLCAYCYVIPDSPTIDHIVPRADGGSELEDNWLIVCRECNRKKGRLPLALWKKVETDWLRARIRLVVRKRLDRANR